MNFSRPPLLFYSTGIGRDSNTSPKRSTATTPAGAGVVAVLYRAMWRGGANYFVPVAVIFRLRF